MVTQMLCTNEFESKLTAILGGLALAVAAITLFFAVFNCYNYLWKKRIRKHLIIMFYAFTFTCTLSLIAVDIKYMLNCEFDHLALREKVTFISIVGIYYTVGLSMLQLSLSIKVMLHQLTSEQASFRNKILFVSVYGVLTVMGVTSMALK